MNCGTLKKLGLGLFLVGIAVPLWGQSIPFPLMDDVEDEDNTNALWVNDSEQWSNSLGAAHSGFRLWQIQPVSGPMVFLTLANSIDLTGARNPRIQLWLQAQDGTVTYRVDASSDGGNSWTQLVSTQINSTEWIRRQFDLSGFVGADTRVRIGAQRWTSGAKLFLDDILVDDAPVVGGLTLFNPTNNGMTVQWTRSGAADFERYRLVFDTDRNGANSASGSQFVEGRRERRVIDIFDINQVELVLDDLTFFNHTYYCRIFERDTQGLWNQGSEVAQLSTTFALDVQVGPGVSDFEGAPGIWGVDRPWTLTQAAAGEAGHSGVWAWEGSPAGTEQASYPVNANRWLVGLWDLSQVRRPVLRFRHRYTFEAINDFGLVGFSADGVDWTDVVRYSGASTGWEAAEVDISRLGGDSRGYVRFVVVSNASEQRDGWHLDDVEIAELPGGEVSFPFFDDVEDSDRSELTWISSDWQLAPGVAHSGFQLWQIVPNGTASYLTLAGSFDLSRASNPHLQIWLKTLGGTATYLVDVSSDGGNNWTRLVSTQVNNTEWIRRQFDLSRFSSSDTRVRIGAREWSRGAQFFLDDILVNDAPIAGGLALIAPTNNGMTAQWTRSTTADFERYRLVFDTDRNSANSVSGSQLVEGRRERRVIDIFDINQVELVLDDLTFVNHTYYCRIFERGQGGLWNQGSEVAQLKTAFALDVQVGPGVQDFEGASVTWGAERPWTLSQAAAEEEGHSAVWAWEDSPAGNEQVNYAPNANRRLIGLWDLSQVARPVLRFRHRYTFEPINDFGLVGFSTDGVDWTNVVRFSGASEGWEVGEVDISPLGGDNRGYVRFVVVSNAREQRDGWHLDDVEVVSADVKVPFGLLDDVETQVLSRRYWIDGNWAISAVDGAHSGDQVWQIIANDTFSYLTMAGPMDLSRVTDPQLSFWFRTEGSGNTNLNVGVSSNGGRSWNRLFQDAQSSGEWKQMVFDLTEFRSDVVRVRIGAQKWTQGNRLLVDDISVDFPPTTLGDLSGDGIVDVMDAVLILQHVTGLRILGTSSLRAGDVSGNGRVSAFDATLVLQFVAGLIERFPAEGGAKPVAASGRLYWDMPQADAVGQLRVPLVLATESRQVRSVEVSVEFDRDQMDLQAVQPHLPKDWQWAHKVEDGRLHLSMAGITPLEGGHLADIALSLAGESALWAGQAALGEQELAALNRVELQRLPLQTGLEANYPNPFNPSTRIQYRLAAPAQVHLAIYNLVGQRVRTLVDERRLAGIHAIEWDGRDQRGGEVESGVYFYRLETPQLVQSRKMVLVQ